MQVCAPWDWRNPLGHRGARDPTVADGIFKKRHCGAWERQCGAWDGLNATVAQIAD
jgi:hypothetical protein